MLIPTSMTGRRESDGIAKRSSAVMSGTYDPANVGAVLIAVSICGWIVMGIFAILVINGLLGRVGRWVPNWYLDASGSRADKAWLCGWWTTVVLFWPFILIILGIRHLVERFAAWVRQTAQARRDKKRLASDNNREEEAATTPAAENAERNDGSIV
jgi:hypothetical protein